MKFWNNEGRKCRWIQEKLTFRRKSSPTPKSSLSRKEGSTEFHITRNIKHKFLVCGPQASGKTTIYTDFCEHYATSERISMRLPNNRSTLDADRKTLQTIQNKLGINSSSNGKRTSGAWQANMGRRSSSVMVRGLSPRNSSLTNPRMATSTTLQVSTSLQANQPLLLQKREHGSLPDSEKSDLGYGGTPRTSVNHKYGNNPSTTPNTQIIVENKAISEKSQENASLTKMPTETPTKIPMKTSTKTPSKTPTTEPDDEQPESCPRTGVRFHADVIVQDEGIEERPWEVADYLLNGNFSGEPMSDIYEPTKNIQEQVLRKMGAKCLDVGGGEDQKRLWPFCFAGLSVILFVVSMDEFAFELDYQEDTLILFSRLINNRYLRNIPFLVVFNKLDKFEWRMENDEEARNSFCKNMGVEQEEASDRDVYEPLLENQFREFVNGQQQLYERQHNDADRWPVVRKSTCEFQTTSLNSDNKSSSSSSASPKQATNAEIFQYQSRIKGFYFMNALDPTVELREDVFTLISNLRHKSIGCMYEV